MKFKTKSREDVRIDLTSMVDMVFLLIIFFLIATTMDKEKTIDVNLAQSKGETIKEKPTESSIVIDSNGNYYFKNQSFNIEQLKEELQNIDVKSNILIKADQDSAYKHLLKLIDLLYELNLTNLNFVTE